MISKPENVQSMFGHFSLDAEDYIKKLEDDVPYPSNFHMYTPLSDMM